MIYTSVCGQYQEMSVRDNGEKILNMLLKQERNQKVIVINESAFYNIKRIFEKFDEAIHGDSILENVKNKIFKAKLHSLIEQLDNTSNENTTKIEVIRSKMDQLRLEYYDNEL